MRTVKVNVRVRGRRLSFQEMAGEMHVSRNRVKSHVVVIYRKLGMHSRSEAVTLSCSIGLLP